MRHLLKVLNVEGVSLDLDDGGFVLVHVAIVRSREYRDHTRQLLRLLPVMYLVALDLDLMCSDN
jgi:hypothetical protein